MPYPEEFQGFAVTDPKKWATPHKAAYKPKPVSDFDIDIEIECCGICSSDLHTIQGNWGKLDREDLVVGHEIIGKVVAVGPKVTKHKLGDRVGVGAQCHACLKCNRCHEHNESYCLKEYTSTYNSSYLDSDYISQGGYASHHRVHEHFAFNIPENIESVHAAPLLCGGLTVYSPLKRAGTGPGKTVGVVGIGGLGHMAIFLAKAMGARVVAFSRSSAKKAEALEIGADDFVATGESDDWEAGLIDTFDVVLNCASHLSGLTLDKYMRTLKVDKLFTIVGLPCIGDTYEYNPFSSIASGSGLKMSKLGSAQEMEELLALVSKHNLKPWVEEVKLNEKNLSEALVRLDKGDVRYRFVLTDIQKAF